MTAEDDGLRSDYVRRLVHKPDRAFSNRVETDMPRVIIQFWHDARNVPSDVRDCVNSWDSLTRRGFQHELFDDDTARRFIAQQLGRSFVAAFDRCHHPAMRCDYFRLCYLLTHGGFYVDADDYYLGTDCEELLDDGRLKLQPLCYDSKTATMVPPTLFADERASSPDWIFYVNNNPLIAPRGHPIIRMALGRSTQILLHEPQYCDIQSTTGPGNLTASVVRHAAACELAAEDHGFTLLPRWELIAVSRWPLGYRNDDRNWRLWNPAAKAPVAPALLATPRPDSQWDNPLLRRAEEDEQSDDL